MKNKYYQHLAPVTPEEVVGMKREEETYYAIYVFISACYNRGSDHIFRKINTSHRVDIR